jgi:hypothetical protein
MKLLRVVIPTSLIIFSLIQACGRSAPEHKGHRVFFIEPVNGAQIRGPVAVKMGVEGMMVRADGNGGIGHHHLIINGEAVKEGEIIPKNETHIHFGKGETETELDLKPGVYTLTLQFADSVHRSYGHSMSDTIRIEVIR